MTSDSIFKNILASFCKTLFGVIGFGVGLIVLFAGFSAIFSPPATAPHVTTLRVLPDDHWKSHSFSHEAPTILRIDLTGVIGVDHMRKEDIFQQLIESQEGELKAGQVKGIIIHINSPGGTAGDADAIYRLLQEYKFRFKIPVVAFIEGLCASGGMYVACAADKIYATEDSIVGHIGVLLSPPFFNFAKLMEKLGIQSKTIYAGKDKDAMNPFRPWRPDEGGGFQNIVDFMYDRFKGIVAKNRPKLTVETLTQEGAQIYPAPVAEELGYIDQRIESIDDLLKSFATELGIYEDYQYVQLERRDFLEDLFGIQTSTLFGRQNELRIHLPGDLPPELYGTPLYLYLPPTSSE